MTENHKRWQDWEVDLLQKDYANFGPIALAEKLGRTRTSVLHKVNRLKIPAGDWKTRLSANSDTVNALYFDQDWNEEMAWVVGYLHADANIVCGNSNSIQLDCQRCDEELVWFVRNILNSKHKVAYTDSYIDNNGDFHGPAVRCAFTNKVLVQSLIKKTGLCNNKSYSDLLLPDSLPEELQSHYLRGYFDGDGWLNANDTSFGFVGTPMFLEQVVSFLAQKGMKQRPIEKNGKGDVNKKVRWYTLKDRKILYNYFYGCNSKLFLKRKKDRFEERLS